MIRSSLTTDERTRFLLQNRLNNEWHHARIEFGIFFGENAVVFKVVLLCVVWTVWIPFAFSARPSRGPLVALRCPAVHHRVRFDPRRGRCQSRDHRLFRYHPTHNESSIGWYSSVKDSLCKYERSSYPSSEQSVVVLHSWWFNFFCFVSTACPQLTKSWRVYVPVLVWFMRQPCCWALCSGEDTLGVTCTSILVILAHQPLTPSLGHPSHCVRPQSSPFPRKKELRIFGIRNGAGTYFRGPYLFLGYDKAEWKILKGRSRPIQWFP